MSDIVAFSGGGDLSSLADMFGGGAANDDLAQGILPSFAAVSVKGKVWRVSYKGEARIIKNQDGDPMPFIHCVIVKASPAISKLYYEKSYQEGDDDAPDCFSLNGETPDPSSPKKQSPTCAACPKNVFGSRITENGSKAKACSDTRRVALVPYPDIRNEMFGGPMLLRVPPTSLQELYKYGNALKEVGAPYQAVVTRIGFDPELAYPRLQFRGIKTLTVEEAQIIREMMGSDQVERMLSAAAHAPAPQSASGAATSAPAATQAPAEEKPAPEPVQKAEEPKAAPAEEQMVMGFGDPAPAKEEPKAEKAKESPAKQATAPAEEVSSELNSVIANLLG